MYTPGMCVRYVHTWNVCLVCTHLECVSGMYTPGMSVGYEYTWNRFRLQFKKLINLLPV